MKAAQSIQISCSSSKSNWVCSSISHSLGKVNKCALLAGLLLFSGISSMNAGGIDEKIDLLMKQNEELISLVQSQQKEIAALRNRVDALDEENIQQIEEMGEIREIAEEESFVSGVRQSFTDNIRISGEAGIAFFSGGKNGKYPNDEFRVDDAQLLIEAQVTEGVYLVTELELYKRETTKTDIQVGELYVEIENLFSIEGYDRLINFRGGRMDIPFGMEYQVRNVMSNPLITHSVADFWGIDEGIEFFGEAGNFNYVLAIQNGSVARFRDFDSDKSITARVGYGISGNANVSLSYMRTGNINVENDGKSEMWIGNGFFLSTDWPQPVTFNAEIVQLDGDYSWSNGNVRASIGQAWYSDDIPGAINSREFDIYMLEIQQFINELLYVSVRYSGIEVDKGFLLRGLGGGSYAPGSSLSTELTRLSFGVGYWAKDNVLFKVEYALEDGKEVGWTKREGTDQFAAELGVRF